MKLEWFWPYDTAKECWLAAMGLLYDKKPHMVEEKYGDNTFHVIESYPNFLMDGIPMEQSNAFTMFTNPMRPIHPHRWLAEKYEEGQKWQSNPHIIQELNIEDSKKYNIPTIGTKHVEEWGISTCNYNRDYHIINPEPMKIDFSKDHFKFRPHPELEPELFAWYEKKGKKK